MIFLITFHCPIVTLVYSAIALLLSLFQAKQMYNSLQRHSTSGGGGLASSSRSKTSDAIDVDYDNVEDCGGGGAVMGGNGNGSGIVVHGDSGDSGVIVRESRGAIQ